MGRSLLALLAGYMPNTTPMNTENAMAIHATLTGIVSVICNTGARALTATTEMASPSSPPMRLTTRDAR